MNNRDYLVSCILAGLTPIANNLFVGQLEPTDLVITENARLRAYEDAVRDGIFTHIQWLEELVRQDLWSVEKEERIQFLQDATENMKVELYNCFFRSNTASQIRKQLATAKEELNNLQLARNTHWAITCEGYSDWVATQYRVALSLVNADGVRVCNRRNPLKRKKFRLDHIAKIYERTRPGETEIREIARTNPWREYWTSGTATGSVFFGNMCGWTDEQKRLIGWSRLFDSAMSHPDFPGDEVLDDDDLLDGWLIKTKREREAELFKRRGSSAIGKNDKLSKAKEVFIIAETAKDAMRVNQMNDTVASMKRKRKLSEIPDTGEKISEGDMRSVQQEIMMQAQRQFMEHLNTRSK